MNARLEEVRRYGCGGCGHPMEPFFSLDGVPVNSCILVDSREEALAFPRGDIELAFCAHCGFVSNVAFRKELTEYSGRYEETQGFSGTFSRFHKALAHDLVERLKLKAKRVVEIGCGKGEFLALICVLGGNVGLGFDPSYDDKRGILKNANARVVTELFGDGDGDGKKHATRDADFVCCKMTLEHIPVTAPFVKAASEVLKPSEDSTIFFQVPDAMRILSECAFEDVYYEHCSYFTAGSLARLFRAQGIEVNRLESAYGGQYLTIEGSPVQHGPAAALAEEETVESLRSHVRSFGERFRTRVAAWNDFLESRSAEGPVVLWGSGSKAVSFLRAVPAAKSVEHVVDINPYRQGHFMPGTGQRIVAPSELANLKPRAVIAMNAIYRSEIAEELGRLGITVELVTL